MTEPAICTPTLEGLARAEEVLRRWLPAFLAGERADEELYADVVTTWHNIGEREVEVQRTPSRTRARGAGAELRVTDVRVQVFDGGWVLQSVTVGTAPDGTAVRIPSCLVARLVDGRIARFEEYADSRATEALLAALT
jgi:ketosteroid isomerase-like protein